MKQEIIDLTYDLIAEIKGSLEFKRILELKKMISLSTEIEDLISEFKTLKTKYEEVIKYGKYHPDLKKVQNDFSIAKSQLYNNEIVKEYKNLEKEIQKKLDYVSESIAKSVSHKIKHPNEIGLINKH
jgi:cell fate (sporulation/competence/biofilm development) regulator YlbF (YheA/YmcA/DUF963 family)